MDKVSFLGKTLGILDNQGLNVNRLIIKAHQCGLRVQVYANQSDASFGYADDVTVGSLSDKDQLKQFANQCDWVIYTNGVDISSALIDYLKQFTAVPQGADELDLINDQSILHVFLDSLHVKSLPYSTVFSVDDVKQNLAKMHYPAFLRPVQTDVTDNRSVVLTDESQLTQIKSQFNGGSFILESLPEHARYFSLTLFNTEQGTYELPIVENHYQGSKFDFANLNSELSSKVINHIQHVAQKIVNQLSYVGGLTFSLILTEDGQVYVNGLTLPFQLENNVFNHTNDDVDLLMLRVIMGLDIRPAQSFDQTWLVKLIDQTNVESAHQLMVQNSSISVNLSSLRNSTRGKGYALISGESLEDAKEKLQESQL